MQNMYVNKEEENTEYACVKKSKTMKNMHWEYEVS